MQKLSWCIVAGLGVLLSGCYAVSSEEQLFAVDEAYCSEDVELASTGSAWRVERNVAPAVPASAAADLGANSRSKLFLSPEQRKLTYTAWLTLESFEQAAVISQAKSLVEGVGGYVERLNNDSATLRLPIERADELFQQIEKLAPVTERMIEANDVTTQMVDVQVRLENLTVTRSNLTALMQKAGKVEEMLQVERELSRVTLELERFQAELKTLANQVNYVSLHLTVETPPEVAPVVKELSPVPWVAQMGEGVWRQPVIAMENRQTGPFDVEVPADFVLMQSNADQMSYLNAEQVVMRMSKKENLEGGTLMFWEKVLSHGLGKLNGFTAVGSEPANWRGLDAIRLTFTRQVNNQPYCYQVTVMLEGDDMYLFETWGPEEAWLEVCEAVDQAWERSSVRRWWEIF